MVSLDRIKSDLLEARKAKDAVAVGLLNPLLGEATRIGKDDGNRETTSDEVVRVVKKFLDSAREILPHMRQRAEDSGDSAALENHRREIAILEGYTPKQMTEDELRKAVTDFVKGNAGSKMGDVMAFLKRDHVGTYDGRMASAIAKEALA